MKSKIIKKSVTIYIVVPLTLRTSYRGQKCDEGHKNHLDQLEISKEEQLSRRTHPRSLKRLKFF